MIKKSFVRNKKPNIGKITTDNRIMASTNASWYKHMISQDLNSEIKIKGENYINSKNKLINH